MYRIPSGANLLGCAAGTLSGPPTATSPGTA
jgi:hypothetical protein